MGRDKEVLLADTDIDIFQSTRPAWGATVKTSNNYNKQQYFNPRAPHGARLQKMSLSIIDFVISIHAPRMGRDH